MRDPSNQISNTLKTKRSELGWSLDRTARETGVSKAMLGQIERGESSPTVATLWKIATGTGTSLSSFLESSPKLAPEGVLIKPDPIKQHEDDAGFEVNLLLPFDPHFGFELFEITFAPGYERVSEPHTPGIVEHITMIDGEMEVLVGGSWRKVPNGHCLRFPADQEHGYRNPTNQTARSHNLIHYPNNRLRKSLYQADGID